MIDLYPHQNQPVERAGAALADARAAMILIHGRGATAESVLMLADEFGQPDVAYIAPQAAGNTWYPHSFLAPIQQNSPGISSGLQVIDDLIDQLKKVKISKDRIVLLGFSQGACLATEYAARNPKKYGGIVGLSGGLIGPDGTPRDYTGSFDQTPVFLGCSDVDFHIPLQRVNETAEVFERMEAKVTKRIYEGMGHTVNEDEVGFVREMLREL
ncbi:MAG: alpha/beta fold hydrolase [Balneolales bacterium]